MTVLVAAVGITLGFFAVLFFDLSRSKYESISTGLRDDAFWEGFGYAIAAYIFLLSAVLCIAGALVMLL